MMFLKELGIKYVIYILTFLFFVQAGNRVWPSSGGGGRAGVALQCLWPWQERQGHYLCETADTRFCSVFSARAVCAWVKLPVNSGKCVFVWMCTVCVWVTVWTCRTCPVSCIPSVRWWSHQSSSLATRTHPWRSKYLYLPHLQQRRSHKQVTDLLDGHLNRFNAWFCSFQHKLFYVKLFFTMCFFY